MADTPFVSLYRRFRPGRFDEIRGQDHVVRALQSAVRDERVSHAYLFSGPRGTGKTSSARILAKALNCEAPVDGEPCGTCLSCTEIAQGSSLNVHELDAASNNGVDAMRDLVAHAGLGTPGRWKVYIVDEVHMLSTAAANALLKTLEEPPSHVVFVLATTDPQKVPPTIRSRTQHLEFRLLGAETLHGLVESVNAEAGLQLGEDALEAAVRRGRGSARDALSALDQVVASGSTEAARPELEAVLDAVTDGAVNGVLVALSALTAAGWGPQQLATELIDDLRQVFLAALAPELCAASGSSLERFRALAETIGLARTVRTMELLGHALVDMREAPDAHVVLEIAMVRAVRPDLDSDLAALSERVSVLERSLSGDAAFPRRAAGSNQRPGATPSGAGTPSEPAPVSGEDDVGRRRTIGAVRRSQRAPDPGGDAGGSTAADRAPGTAEPPPVPVSAEPPPVPGSAEPPPVPGSTAPPPVPGSTAPPPVPVDAASATVVHAPPRSVDRDSLTEAWGDGILQGLPARAKARFASGRFVAVDEQGAHFALPNAAHRDQCIEHQQLVETALAAHFGTEVRLVLVVDGASDQRPVTAGTAADPRRGGPPAAARSHGVEAVETVESEDVDVVDPGEFATSAEDDQAAAAARLLQAFPGASEVSS